jgi:outer membrane receptor protein involved in Fe transport
MNDTHNHQRFLSILIFAITTISIIATSNLHAQALEEIVVTAQRRVQSLQEVPISIGVYSGAEIDLQGYKNLDDLARFSASVNISEGVSGQNTTIRGFGTAGSSLTLISATPLFVDGIHFGSNSMIKNAFMDTERVEVLKGPQPLHFGMNATAGAFNIMSKRPTNEFEGDFSTEFGNDGKRELFGALSGPISDTLGFRVVGSYDANEGPLKSRIDHSKFPQFDSLGGRLMLEWDPSDNLNVLTKFEINRQRNGGEIGSGCAALGRPLGYTGSPVNDGIDDLSADIGVGNRVYLPVESGGLSNGSLVAQGELVQFDPKYSGKDCFKDDYGISRNGPWAKPTITNLVRSGQSDIFAGYIDVAALQDAFHSQPAGVGVPGVNGTDGDGNRGYDNIDSYHGLFDVTYEFDNGISVNSQTAYVRFFRDANSDSGDQPFSSSNQHRRIDMYQHSQQVRVESPAEGYDLDVDIEGGLNMNFTFGAFYQAHDKDLFSSNIRDNFRRGQRYNDIWEDANWKSGFWGLDFNFMDKQLSLQVGGRYTDVHKEVFVGGYGASLIFDEVPCDAGGDPTDPDSFNPLTCTPDGDFKRVDPNLTTYTIIDPITGLGGPGTSGYRTERRTRVDSPRIFIDGADMDNLWTTAVWRRRSDVPLNYRGAQEQAVGLTAPELLNRNGPWGPCGRCIEDVIQDANNYDSQIVISYTPNGSGFEGNHTVYGKYATAFKGPVTDTGTSTIPSSLESIQFTPEFSKSWEVGVRGTLWEGRVRYDMTGFKNDFTDLQTDVAVANFDPTDSIDQQGESLNAGNQSVDGFEFSFTAAATENLTVNLAGSILDAKFGDFDGGGCSDSEVIAKSILILETKTSGPNFDAADEFRSNMGRLWDSLPSSSELPQEFFRNGGCRLIETRAFANEESSVGEDLTINRSGARPAFAPPYKIVMGATYTLPVLENYEIMLNAQGYFEGEKILVPGNLAHDRMYNDGHWDMNISGGFGPADGSWQVLGFIRNLMEDKVEFNQQYDLTRTGIKFSEDRALSKASFQTYGVRFEYNFR